MIFISNAFQRAKQNHLDLEFDTCCKAGVKKKHILVQGSHMTKLDVNTYSINNNKSTFPPFVFLQTSTSILYIYTIL